MLAQGEAVHANAECRIVDRHFPEVRGNGAMKAAKIGVHYHDVRNGLRDASSPEVQAAPGSVGESPPDMRFAVIDIGSKSIKTGLIDATSGLIVEVLTRPTPAVLPGHPRGWHQSDPVSIAKIAMELLWDLLSSHPGVAGIGLSTQMNGFLLTDGEDQPVTPFVSWQDERSYASQGTCPASELLAAVGVAATLRTEVPLQPGVPSTN